MEATVYPTELEKQTQAREAAETDKILSQLFPGPQPQMLPELTTTVQGGWLFPLLLGIGAALFLGGGTKRRSLWLALVFALSGTALTAQSVPFARDVVFGADTLTVYGHSTFTITVDSVIQKFTPPPIVLNRPYGPSSLISGMTQPYTPFTADPWASSNTPAFLIGNLLKARQRNIKVLPALPCGAHSPANPGNCLKKNPQGQWVFSRQRFDSALATYNTPAVKAALDTAYKAGALIAVAIMDEPWVKGQGDGNTWGPNGLTRAQADSSCATAKAGAFAGVPVGVSDASSKLWSNATPMKVCDVGIAQFSYWMGQPAMWRDSLLTMSSTAGYQSVFSFNFINGGTQDTDPTWDCAAQGGIKGQYKPNCQMTPAQVITAATALGASGCGSLMMWNYDAARFAKPGFAASFTAVSALQAQRAQTLCKVRP